MNPPPDFRTTAKQIASALERPLLDIHNSQRRMFGLTPLTLEEYRLQRLRALTALNEQMKNILELMHDTPPADVMQAYVDDLYRKE